MDYKAGSEQYTNKLGINVRIMFSIQHLIKKLVSSQTFMKTENESEESTSKVDDTICLSLCLKTHEGTRKKYDHILQTESNQPLPPPCFVYIYP